MYLRRISLVKEKILNPNEFPFIIPSLKEMNSLEITKQVTFFVGENGSGKSTLLEGIAYQCGFHPAGGGVNNRYQVVFLNRFGSKGIYLLDEPEAALSPARQLAFLRLIHELVTEGNSQFILATHSSILLGYPHAQIFNFDTAPITEIDYEETEHYQITKGFLNRREKYLDVLFREDDEGC